MIDEKMIKTNLSKKETRKKVNRTIREFRLRNLKRIAEKNQALCKMARRNMIQACILSSTYIIFGATFIIMNATSDITNIVENSIAGFASVLTFISNIKSFVNPSTDE